MSEENTDGPFMFVGSVKPSYKMRFSNDQGEVGVFNFGNIPATFEGDVDESARLFVNYVCDLLNEKHRAYEAEIEELKPYISRVESDRSMKMIQAMENGQAALAAEAQLSVAMETMEKVYNSVSCKVECKQMISNAINKIEHI